MKTLLGFVALGLLALTGCMQSKPDCCTIKVKEPTPFSREMAQETVGEGFTKAEIRKCFGNGVLNTYGVPIYIVRDTRKTDGKYCHVGFMSRTEKDPNRFQMNPTRHNEWEAAECDLKALSCLRPDAAHRIAARYNMTIDPTPIPKPKS